MKWLASRVHYLGLVVMVLIPAFVGGGLLWSSRDVTTQPDEVQPVVQPAAIRPEVQPVAVRSEAQPTAAQPDTAQSDTAQPDTAQPDTAQATAAQPAAVSARAGAAAGEGTGAQADAAQASPHAGATHSTQTGTQPEALEVAATPTVVRGAQGDAVSYVPDISFTLRTAVAEGKLVFVGVGGDIDGVVNPELHVTPGAVVQVTLVNGDGAQHDWALPDFGAKTDLITGVDASSVTVFKVGEDGTYTYLCTVPGHQAAGMEGKLIVGEGAAAESELASVARDPRDLPGPVGTRTPTTHDLTLTTTEVEARLADGTSYKFWTFDNTVPGPMLRVRVGDVVNLTLENAEDSTMIHSIDLHAVNGPGGGATVTQVQPGGNATFTFKALNPGLYVYHCATPMVAHHITNGMYGLILVEPEGGLPPVDREFYVMQGELYTHEAFGQHGRVEFDIERLLEEEPEYFVFNGAVGALTEEHPMQAEVGDTVRIFFGVGGPNFISSFHVIGEIFDRVYDQASLTAPPLTDVQSTVVPTGGATIVEFKLEVPGRYILVDHSLSRAERGLIGFLHAEGEENPQVFRGTATAGSGH